jgi:hypothetical protein
MKTKRIVATLAVALSCLIPETGQAAVILMVDTQVTVNASIPTAVGTLNSVYNDHEVVNAAPSSTHYGAVFRLRDTVTGQDVPFTAISSLNFTVGHSAGGSFPVNYALSTFAPFGAGSPQFSLYDGAGVDITAAVYGNSVVGTPLPANVMAITVTNQTIPGSFAGGALNPDAPGEFQSGTMGGSATYAGGATIVANDVSTVSVIPEPSSAGLAGLALLGLMARRRR